MPHMKAWGYPCICQKEKEKKNYFCIQYTLWGERSWYYIPMVAHIISNLQKKKKNYSQIYIPFFDFTKTQLKQG